jgi:hypothetical protein
MASAGCSEVVIAAFSNVRLDTKLLQSETDDRQIRLRRPPGYRSYSVTFRVVLPCKGAERSGILH